MLQRRSRGCASLAPAGVGTGTLRCDSDSDNDKSILHCKDMVHVQQAGLLARDVSVGIYLLNMEMYAAHQRQRSRLRDQKHASGSEP